ncbi:MAG TPA: DinB family protein [Gemmataceae bacterium]|nr:DinB family protein [Gemmataceae bacterium]
MPEFLNLFGRASVAEPDRAAYPPAAELRSKFDRVHVATLEALAGICDHDLEGPVIGFAKHRLYTVKWEFLRWAGRHEMIHTGQIGLLRRILG